MSVSRRFALVVAAGSLVAGLMACSASEPKLPVYDQAMHDNAALVDVTNNVHVQLVDGGWGILVAKATYTNVAGESIKVLEWYNNGSRVYTLNEYIIGYEREEDGLSCDVPVTPAPTLKQLLVHLASPSYGTQEPDDGGTKFVYHCH